MDDDTSWLTPTKQNEQYEVEENEVVRNLISLREKGTMSEEVYRQLLQAVISGYIQGVVTLPT